MTATEVGQTIHFAATGLTVPLDSTESRVMRRGDVLTVTAALRRAGTDRNGSCWLDASEEDQVRKHGCVHGRPGQLPEGFERLEPGSAEWDDARVAALRAAALLPDPDEQRIAAAEVRAKYGSSAESSSRTLAYYGPSR